MTTKRGEIRYHFPPRYRCEQPWSTARPPIIRPVPASSRVRRQRCKGFQS